MENPAALYSKPMKALVNGADICRGAKYAAISHTWSMWDNVSKGNLRIQQDANCEGTASFTDMMAFVNTEWVWIDTLCIKEENKVLEIPNMRRYYMNAAVVLVVLDTSKGEYNLGDLKANDLGGRIETIERMCMLDSCPEKVTTECTLSEEGVTIYNTLCKMFKAEWFKRGWTLQEVLLAKEAIIWNGSSSVSVTDVRKCIDWLGGVLPDVLKNGLQCDDDYSAMQRLFHTDSRNIPYELVDELMEGRRCKMDEDYVYSILGLLDINIAVEYGISLQECKRRLFTRLVQEQRAASVFTHFSIGVLPIHSEYGTSLIDDNPRADRVVYSLSHNGVKFTGCSVYIYKSIGLFSTEIFDKDDPKRNMWEITRIMGDDLSKYKDLVRAIFCITGSDDNEFLITKPGWFLEMAKLSATTSAEKFDAPLNSDCLHLHGLLNRPDTPLISYGMVHNNVSVCAYIFVCLEAVPKGDKCLLLAPSIVGEVRETGILCSGHNPHKSRQRKIGATLNLRKDELGTIEPIANLSEVDVIDRKTG